MANGGAVAPARRGLAAHVGAARGLALLLLDLLRSFVTITAMNHRSRNETTGSTWLERAALVSEPHRDTVVELVLVPLFVEHRLEHAERSVLFRVRCRIRIREVCIAQCVLTVGSSPSPAAPGFQPPPRRPASASLGAPPAPPDPPTNTRTCAQSPAYHSGLLS